MERDIARVSVVIPCYNAGPYLASAIESALGQDPAPREIVVVDDGSTDGSAAAARTYGARVRCVRQENQGISAARNRGVELTDGELLAFLDADDLWPAHSLRVRLARFTEDPALECVYGAVEQFVSEELDASLQQRLEPAIHVMAGRFAGSMLLKREAFLRTGGFDASLRLAETLDWVARAEDAGVKTAAVPAVVLRRRIHTSNTVTREKARHGDYLRALHASLLRRRRSTTTAHE